MCTYIGHAPKQGEMTKEIDRFFLDVWKPKLGSFIDGNWNLVLYCKDYNRDADGELERTPTVKLLQRLHTRNGF